MPALRVIVAFAFGALLYQVAVVHVGGVLAAVAVPRSYFEWFGRANAGVGLALSNLALFALPVMVLVAGGVLAARRVLGGSTRALLVALLAGLVASHAHWVVAAANTMLEYGVAADPPGGALRQRLLPPWWALSGAIAPWAGFALAAWLVRR